MMIEKGVSMSRYVFRTIFSLLFFLLFAVFSYGAVPKYIFLFIGDGMGNSQLTSAEVYINSSEADKSGYRRLNITSMDISGFATTYSMDSFITDSAAAGTALATGYKTDSGIISMDPGGKTKYETVAMMAKEKGMKVGIVSSVSLDHATPACFYANRYSRSDYYEIALQLAQSDFDYFAGGGIKGNSEKYRKGRLDILEAAVKNGFTVAQDRKAFQRLKNGDGKVIAMDHYLDGSRALYYEIDRRSDSISLKQFTEKGIEMLDNEKGFFLMVEGGKIDWACHANDAASSIKDVLAFDSAVGAAMRFLKEHPEETLIVVTADHECGGMTIGFAGTGYSTYMNNLDGQTMSGSMFWNVLEKMKEDKREFSQVLKQVEKHFGLKAYEKDDYKKLSALAKKGDDEAGRSLRKALTADELKQLDTAYKRSLDGEEVKTYGDYLLYGGYDPFIITLTHILNSKSGIGWTSYSHTGAPVPVFSSGSGAQLFSGYYDNTDIAKKIIQAAGLKE